jgi:hypothetical protein
MKYQLVLQFSASSLSDFDDLVRLEEKLEQILGSHALVDGHDIGHGEFNIFILTDAPAQAFQKIRPAISQASRCEFRAAYRDVDADAYTILWPPNLTHFAVA